MKSCKLFIISFFILFNTSKAFSQFLHSSFIRFNSNNGLSNNNVHAITQDNQGYIYFGTEDGLNRFNGYKISALYQINYRLQSTFITALTYQNNSLYIATLQGLYAVDPSNFNIQKIKISPFVSYIYQLVFLGNQLAIGTNNGLLLYNIKTKKCSAPILKNLRVLSLFYDKKTLLIGTDKGLFTLNPATLQISFIKSTNRLNINAIAKFNNYFFLGTNSGLFAIDKSNKILEISALPILTTVQITSLLIDFKKYLWIGTRSHGIIKIYNCPALFTFSNIETPEKIQFQIYVNQKNNPYSLSSNYITTIFQDNHNNIWIGTIYGGVNKFIFNSSKISWITKNIGKELSSNHVTSVIQDQKGNIWIGTAEAGINIWDKKHNRFSYLNTQNHKLSSNNINVLFEDSKGRLWVGTLGSGIDLINPENNSLIKHFNANPNNPNSLSSNYITAICEDSLGNIWIGTIDNGLNKLNTKTWKFKHFTHIPNDSLSISSNYITTLFIDKQKRLWVGTNNGLNLLNYKQNTFFHFLTNPNLPPKARWISSIKQTKDGKIWIATHKGLAFINPITNKVKFIDTLKTYFYTSKLLDILVDKNNKLWITTPKGLIYFDPKTLKTYTPLDNSYIFDHSITPKASIITKDGNLIISTNKGLKIFNPNNISLDTSSPQAIFSNITLFTNHSIKKLSSSAKIINIHSFSHKLKFNLDVISLNHKNFKLQYKLIGKDSAWHTISSPFLIIHNLKPKKYILKLRTISDKGIIYYPNSNVVINVSPDITQYWWYKYLIFFILISFGIIYLVIKIILHFKEKKLLEQKVEEKTKQLLEVNKKLKEMYNHLQDKTEYMSAQNEILIWQNKKIKAQTQAILQQSKLLKTRTEEIEASLRYAHRLQKAIFPSNEQISKIFPHHFILFMPREAISGDFYWLSPIKDKILVAVGDSTGHGVPGALMSFLGISIINKIVLEYKIYQPSQILERLRSDIIRIFTSDQDQPYDGMDIFIAEFDFKKQTITYASANQIAYLINYDNAELIELKGDKMPVGRYYNMHPFSQFSVSFNIGDIIYLFTDGYPDQFGGPHSKKFKYNKFRETLMSIYTLPMKDQLNILQNKILDWMAYPDKINNLPNHEQIDDILVFGIKLVTNV